jgi:hypothetical protein
MGTWQVGMASECCTVASAELWRMCECCTVADVGTWQMGMASECSPAAMVIVQPPRD